MAWADANTVAGNIGQCLKFAFVLPPTSTAFSELALVAMLVAICRTDLNRNVGGWAVWNVTVNRAESACKFLASSHAPCEKKTNVAGSMFPENIPSIDGMY